MTMMIMTNYQLGLLVVVVGYSLFVRHAHGPVVLKLENAISGGGGGILYYFFGKWARICKKNV